MKETLRFFQHATGSIAEAENQILIATDIGYIHPKTSDALVEQIVTIRRMLYRLAKNLEG